MTRGVAVDDPDGYLLLTSARAAALLATAVRNAGGQLVDWRIDQIDRTPGHSTIATYSAVVDWPYGRREEVLGVSCRADGLTAADAHTEIFADGDRQVAFWFYPQDPDLPGLAQVAYVESLAEICNAHHSNIAFNANPFMVF